MPLYQYKALDTKGKKVSGTVEANSDREAKGVLRDQGVMVTTLKEKTVTASRENLRGDNLLSFTVQLGQLVSAGVPLYDSLIAMEEQYRKESFHRVILGVCEQIKRGSSLSDGMNQYPDSFNSLYCSMVQAGESVGALDIVLEKLGELLAKQSKLKKQISTAMIYPLILASFSLLIIAMLLGFVVPSIEEIFEGRQLNQFTEIVLGVSGIARTYWWIYIPVLIAIGVGCYYKLSSEEGRFWREKISLKIPFLRTLVIQTALARFCRTMGTLLGGGLPMIDSLRISRGVMRNVVLEDEIQEAESRIIEGSSLSAEIGKSEYIPQMVSRMLAVGEDSGTTTVMLNKIADIYEDEIEKSIDQLMALLQPVILILMGGIIVVIMLALLLPLTDVGSLSAG